MLAVNLDMIVICFSYMPGLKKVMLDYMLLRGSASLGGVGRLPPSKVS